MIDYKAENRIELALEIRNMKKIELAERTGISKATISNWANQKYQPKQTPLMKMAKVLDVSEMWLAGYDCPMERPAKQKQYDKINAISEVLENNERLANLMFSITSLTDTQLTSVENLVSEFAKLNLPH